MADIPTFVPAFGVYSGVILQGVVNPTVLAFQTPANTGAIVLPLVGKIFEPPLFVSSVISSSNPFFQAGATGGGALPPITRGQGFPLGDGNF